MNQSIQQVKEFHETFNHPVGTLSEPESLEVRQLRIKLLFEELCELAEAGDCKYTFSELCSLYLEEGAGVDGNNVNQLEELDALCDIQYVLNGKILTAGMHEIFDKNFDLVHQNNMSKAHRSIAHAQQTINYSNLTEGHIEAKGEYFILTNSVGKIIKPWDHQKVALSLI